MRERGVAKSDSLLSILWMLQSRGKMTALELSQELDVDVRTVYRYIDSLSASGAPIIAESGPNGGYTLLDTFRETPLYFTKAERVALAHASLFAQRAGYPFSDALNSALEKMEQRMSPEQLSNLQQHVSGLHVIEPGNAEITLAREDSTDALNDRSRHGVEVRLRVMEEAIADARRLTITHRRDLTEKPLSRQIDPYGLIYWHETWYLIGFCLLRQDIRMFRCDRIIDTVADDAHFSRPRNFSAREYFLSQMVPVDSFADTVTVRIAGTARAIDSLSRHWYYRNFIREQTMSSLGFAIEPEEAIEYLPDVLISYGTSLRVVEPEALQLALSEKAKEVLSVYQSGWSPSAAVPLPPDGEDAAEDGVGK